MRRDDSEATANHSSASSGGNVAEDREGNDASAQARDSEGVLQPDVSFGADPRVHILHSVVITAGFLTSIALLLAYLPLSIEPGQPQHLGLSSAPWIGILLPFILASICGAAFHIYYILVRKRAIEMQLGPSPNPETTVGGAILQHSILTRVFMKQYVASNVSDAILFIGMAASVAACLGYTASGSLPTWRVVVLPFAAAGVASLVLHTMYRIRGRGALPSISTRTDFMVVFVYLVAYKLDSDAALSWTVTFIFGFWWVCVSVLIGVCALLILLSGRRAAVWSRSGLRIRAAHAAAHLSAALLLAALILLLTFMRAGHDLRVAADVRKLRAALACMAAWLAASCGAQVVAWGAQRDREAQRRRQIAAGNVWTALYNTVNGWTTLVRHVDSLTSEEIAQKAEEMMAGVQKPERLFRLAVNLWGTQRNAKTASAPDPADAEAAAAGCVSPIWGVKSDADAAELTDEAEDAPESPAHDGHSHAHSHEHGECGGAAEAGGAAAGEVALALKPASEDGDGGDRVCMICYDAQADYVVLPCGHGGYCKACATKVFVRPPSQCSVCRTRLTAVVKVSLDTPIGEGCAVE